MKPLVGLLREQRLAPIIRANGRAYDLPEEQIPAYQLQKFNGLWTNIHQHVPYYRQLVQDGVVPGANLQWDDFANLPVLERANFQKNVLPYVDNSKPIDGWSVTGGSTGTPIRVPRWASENIITMPAIWLGRAPYGIHVSDRMFHLWGHSHLFGRGWKRYFVQTERKIKNLLLGYQTFSAYNLNSDRLAEAGQSIVEMRPDYIIGYSRSLTLLAKANRSIQSQLQGLGLKAVIATTEAFSGSEDMAMIEEIFGCPVALEYGAAETGVIAYTQPGHGSYRVFWDLFLLEAIPLDEQRARLLLTTLYPRAMPLIRYDIGDLVVGTRWQDGSVIGFESVLGRDNDLIEFEPGVYIHPVALIHSIQSLPGVLGMQVVQETDGTVTIRIMSESLGMEGEHHIRNNLGSLHPRLASCPIEYAQTLEQTIAGKTRWVVKR